MANVEVVPTPMSGQLQTVQYVKRSISPIPNSTLNQKFGIQESLLPAVNEIPGVKYVGIGRGGHGFTMTSGGRQKFVSRHHKPTDTGMWSQVPFVLRPVGADLTPSERARYRLRRLETHFGETYYAYYLRVLDVETPSVSLELRHTENGITTVTPWAPTLEDLSPIPPALTTGSAVTTTGDKVASSIKVPFTMNANDTAEFVQACQIIDNEDGLATISEVATISGLDRTINPGGIEVAYTEVIYAQIASFIATGFNMDYQASGMSMILDIGNVEPLRTTTPV